MIPAATALGGAGFALSALAKAIAALYEIAGDINAYIDRHIEDMKASDNLTISRVGAILGGAKFGFGLGYISSVVIMATGQLLLGNSLAAVGVLATAATVSNPIAMTCAAVGAIYFGWQALSNDEREALLEKLRVGLEIGVELIKSIVNFLIDEFRKLSDSKIFKELKEDIRVKARLFGKTLSDITHDTKDRLSDWKVKVGEELGDATDTIIGKAKSAGVLVADKTSGAFETVKDEIEIAIEKTRRHGRNKKPKV